MEGFIQLHRKITEWDWYTDLPTFKLFIHCLIKANHKQKNWRGQTIKRGQFITSTNKLSIETGLTLKQVRLSIDKLIKTGELGKQTTNANSMITVLNYKNYQSKGKPKGELGASEGRTRGELGATTNNDNNNNNEDKNSIESVRSYFIKYAKEKNLDEQLVLDQVDRAWDFYTERDWFNTKGKDIKDRKGTIRNNWFKDLTPFRKRLPKLDKIVAHVSLTVKPEYDKLIAMGYTDELIKQYAK